MECINPSGNSLDYVGDIPTMKRSRRPYHRDPIHDFQKLAIKLGREYVVIRLEELSPATVNMIVQDLQRLTHQLRKAGETARGFVEAIQDVKDVSSRGEVRKQVDCAPKA